MPQGSCLDPCVFCFLVLLNDLDVDCLVHKYVDDTTLTELLSKNDLSSNMDFYLQQLLDWATNNDMVVNLNKTKEMIIGPPAKVPNISPLQVLTGSVERVNTMKLLGVHLDANFSWKSHVEVIVSKATQRLYFLKQLKRAGVPHHQLLHFYTVAIRPVLEYAAPVWHHLLTKSQTDQIEAVQRRAVRVIYNCTYGMPYMSALYYADISSLANRREQLCRRFFKSIQQPTSCLFHLLPPIRDPIVTSRLRNANKLPRLLSRTKKYQTFLSHALAHYQ